MDHQVVSDYSNTTGADETSSIRVFVRARPPEDNAPINTSHFILETSESKITIKNADNENYGDHKYGFSRIFGPESDQREVFEGVCEPHVAHVMSGYNSCCFAFGQTGSGKTYSMFGERGEERGMIIRCVEQVFTAMKEKERSGSEVGMVVSFLEIYCDQIRDLGKSYLNNINGGSKEEVMKEKTSDLFARQQLQRQSSFSRPRTLTRTESGGAFSNAETDVSGIGNTLGTVNENMVKDYESMNYEIHEDLDKNVFVKDLAIIPTTTIQEVMSVINSGLQVRATHETKINEVSSRSHTVFTISVVQRDPHTGESIKGMLNLVDLAGSERLKKSESSGIRLKEALHINTSLTALGKVVLALDPSQNISHVPYRDSKLTRLLQNSLGGNSYTTLIATIHPIANYADECLSTLQFANRCRNVQNKPTVNKASSSKGGDGSGGGGGAGAEGKMKEEINLLKKKLAASESQLSLGADPNIRVLEVLKQLGIEATVNPNGTLMMSDGRVLGSALATGDGEQSNMASATSIGIRGDEFDQMMSGASLELQELVSDLTQQQKQLKQKLKIKKENLEKMTSQFQETQNQHAEVINHMRRAQQNLSQDLHDKTKKLEDLTKVMKETHGNQIQELVSHNQKLLTQQHQMMANVPNVLKVNSSLLQDARTIEKKVTQSERIKYDKELRAIEFGRTAEIQNLKQQYEFWLTKKSVEAKKFVDEFNKYRSARNGLLASYEAEMLEMHDYCVRMKSIVENVEEARYPMRKTRKGMVPVIPKGHLPEVDIIEGEGYLKNARRIVEKKRVSEEHERSIRDRATMTLRNVTEKIESGMPVGVMRPSTAPRLRATEGDDIWGAGGLISGGAFEEESVTTRETDFTNNGASHKGRSSRGSNQEAEIDDSMLHIDTTNMEPKELRKTIESLRAYATTHLRQQIKSQVLNELTNDSTVNYIKELEDEKAMHRDKLREQSLKLNDLRIAYESLQRRSQKAMLRGVGGGKAAGTAIAGGKSKSLRRPMSARPQSAGAGIRFATK